LIWTKFTVSEMHVQRSVPEQQYNGLVVLCLSVRYGLHLCVLYH
jgi:hypothetical protein